MSTLTAGDKLTRLRAEMAKAGYAAYVVPTSDAHNSEYVSRRDARREFISGFTGSAGTAVITHDAAKLWTDGRYFLQAEKELDGAHWALVKDRLPGSPTVEGWLAEALPSGAVVGIDPYLFPCGTVSRMQGVLSKAGISLAAEAGAPNLVDAVWGDSQPAPPSAPMTPHPLQYAGQAAVDKLAAVRAALADRGCDALAVCALDELCWLFNVRGGDIECNPVCIAYAVVTAEQATIFVDEAKVTAELREHLGAGVDIRPYNEVCAAVAAHVADGRRFWLDPTFTNAAVHKAAQPPAGSSSKTPYEAMSPIQLLKALKNDAEIQGFRDCHLRDGAALVTFFAWLEAALLRGVDARTGEPLTGPLNEYTAGEVLESFRREQPLFVQLSFPTILGAGPNGAIIHYRAEAATAAPLTAQQVILCDSGGQYHDGTTDTTRTLHFGTPSAHEKLAYTRVLQGHIGLSAAVVPPGTSGVVLDTLARAPIWASGLDYRHGTGHGVGSFLNVHEGPFGASQVARTTYTEGLKAGMTLTDEPGYYEDGAFGIRIENVLIAHEASAAKVPHRFGGVTYLCFEPVTAVPITARLVEASLLSPAEKAWLNAYNADVAAKLAPLLSSRPWAADYLARETAPI